MELRGKKALVFGLGRSGLAAARALLAHGASVTLTDRKSDAELAKFAPEARALGLGLALGGHPDGLLDGQDLIVLSPGVPGNIPILGAARARGLEVLGEIELAFRLARRRWLAVTGTNGKTTTTSLLAAMVAEAGAPFLLGGNIGAGLADRVEGLEADGLVVAELSSFQLEECRLFRPEVAVLCNLTPDHLDRYPSMEAYGAAKARIFMNQSPEDTLVFNALDWALGSLCAPAKSRKLLFHRGAEVPEGAWISQGKLFLRLPGQKSVELMPRELLKLRGPHNEENALAAAAAAFAAGIGPAAIRRALEGFSGVEHRLEFCGEAQGVRFVNDSKATNVDSVEKALQSFHEPLSLILGGRDKEGDFSRLKGLVKERVARIYLIGEAADKVERQLGGIKPMHRVARLEDAVERGLRETEKGGWVLLSPGCASFDMFDNYEHRGRVFKQAVAQLMKEGSKA